MKIKINALLLIVFLFLVSINFSNVYAVDKNDRYGNIPAKCKLDYLNLNTNYDFYYYRNDKLEHKASSYAGFSIGGSTAYCLNPGLGVGNNYNYWGTLQDARDKGYITSNQARLIAYAYENRDRTSAQMLIWLTISASETNSENPDQMTLAAKITTIMNSNNTGANCLAKYVQSRDDFDNSMQGFINRFSNASDPETQLEIFNNFANQASAYCSSTYCGGTSNNACTTAAASAINASLTVADYKGMITNLSGRFDYKKYLIYCNGNDNPGSPSKQCYIVKDPDPEKCESNTCKDIKDKPEELAKYSSCADIKSKITGIDTCTASGGKVTKITCKPVKTCNGILRDGSYKTYSNCNNLKRAITDSNKVKKCEVSNGKVSVLECSTPPSNPTYTCEELLPEYSGYQSDESFNEFVSRITDKEKATHYSDGTISCNPCRPEVDTGNSICKDKYPTNFSLSDAYNKNSCYLKGTGYQIDGQDAVGSKDDHLSNSYCDVYCWESVDAHMPGIPSSVSGDDKVHAGQMMWWGLGSNTDGLFAQLYTKRICWTNPKYNNFRTDWNANEDEIALAYATYLAKEKYNSDTDQSHVSVADNHCCISGYDPGTPGDINEYDSGSGCPSTCTTQKRNFPEGHIYYGLTYDHCICGTAGTPESCSGGWGKTYTKSEATESITSATGNVQTGHSGTATSECRADAPSAASLTVSNSYSGVEKELNDRVSLQGAINRCQSISEQGTNINSIYNYTATAEFKTDTSNTLNKNGVTDYKLVGRRDDGSTTLTGTTPPTATLSYRYIDLGTLSTNNAFTIHDFSATGYEWNYEGVYNFYYNEQFYFYAIKENMKIVNNVGDYKPAAYIFNKNLYYNEYYGFPIRFDRWIGTLNIGVNIKGLGHNGHFDKVLNQSDAKEKYGYDFQNGYYCPYYVDNPIYDNEGTCRDSSCKPSGLDIVYRVIDMASGDSKRIFPSIDGDGRNPGNNWSVFISSKPTTYKNITTYAKVYDQSPMYTIELTPTNIGAIRNSNKVLREAGKDPYTSYYDENNNLKISCNNKDDETKSCVSSYITELIKRNVIKSGKFKIESEGQRLNALNNYKTCYDVANPHC